MSADPPSTRVFRLPVLTYLPVAFLWIGAFPVAFATDGSEGAPARFGIGVVVMLIPLLATVFVARSATLVNGAGIAVRAPLGRRVLPWDSVRGLSVSGSSVYVVVRDGSIRLPCVRVSNLAEVARASDGRLPEIADPRPKFAPSRKRRR